MSDQSLISKSSKWIRNATRSMSTRSRRHERRSRSLLAERLESRRVFALAILNEVVSDPSGTDQPFEFVEIKGTPGATLPSGFYFVSLEGDSPAAGVADIVLDLGGNTLGSNGKLIIKSSSGGPTVPVATTIVTHPSFDPSPAQTVENGTNSFALIFSPKTVLSGDLDTDNNGVLELPPDAVLIDAVGWSDGGATDVVYGANLVQAAGRPAGGGTRFLHDNRTMEVDAWYGGDLAAPNSGVAYVATAANLTTNFPAGGQLTPGDVNLPGTNTAPIGLSDLYTVAPAGTLTVNAANGVVANDLDPDGANSLLNAKLVTGPTNGTLTLNSDGSFQYINNGTPGLDSFTYQATDLNLLSSIVLVSIDVGVFVNEPPSITLPGLPPTYVEDAAFTVIDSLATVSDSDSANFGGGALTVQITANATPQDRLIVQNEGTGPGQVGVTGAVVSFGGVNIGSFVESTGSDPFVISFNGNATVAAVQAVMRNIAFTHTSNAPSTLARTIRMVVTDGDGGTSNEAFQTVNVTSLNDLPVLSLSKGSTLYFSDNEAVTLDGLALASDADLLDFDGGILSVAITSNAEPSDLLAIRSVGSGVGQVSVSGNQVSFGGVVVASFTGGSGATALTINFNASASEAAVQAILRSLTFQTGSTRLAPPPRSVSFSLSDGDGGTSSTTLLTVQRSIVRKFAFQQGVDNGFGVYAGAADIQLGEGQPTTPLPIGGNPLEGLLVDFDGGTANAQVLMRFDGIFGTGSGQIPVGATIVSARLVVDTNNPGDGGSFHRMLATWNAETATWSDYNDLVPDGLGGFITVGGVKTDGTDARVDFDSQVGTSFGAGDAVAGPTIMGVTADLQAWSSGEANHGWVMKGWDTRTDGWAFSPSESANAVDRPRLEVDWLPPSITKSSFRDGVGGYAGTADTTLRETTTDGANTADNSNTVTLFSDFPDATPSNTSQILIRFDGIQGTGVGQVPAGSLIHAAVLDVASVASDATGDGGQLHAMLQAWDETASWSSIGNGIQTDGVEASLIANAVIGNASLQPNAEAGYHAHYVTTDVQNWSNGVLANHGWAIVPWTGGTNGWAMESSESTVEKNRPQLRVFFTPVGVTVSPIGGLTTTELGGTAQFSIVLNTPPTADVTIGLSSSNTNEGTTSVPSVTFTPSNWDIPQLVTVTGVNDLVADGDVPYQIITAAAVSADANYSGLIIDDVGLTNIGNGGVGGATVVQRSVYYNRSPGANFGEVGGNPINSIDSSKVALLPGQAASFANYTNYVRGLNGIVVDINGLNSVSASDFQFATWNGIDVAGFLPTLAAPTVSVLAGSGLGGSSRVKLDFPDNAIRNTWLRVTILANANTGLTANDVFYFGNAVADFNTGNIGSPTTIRANATDTSAVRQNQSPGINSAVITNIYDVNKDGRVNATDTSLVRQNQLASIIRLFTAPASLQFAGGTDGLLGVPSLTLNHEPVEGDEANGVQPVQRPIAGGGVEKQVVFTEKLVEEVVMPVDDWGVSRTSQSVVSKSETSLASPFDEYFKSLS